MPFLKGHKGGPGRPKGQSKKTVWLLESLTEHGFNYEAVLVKMLDKAAKGDLHAMNMAHLLVKMVPHIANAPKQDVGINQIETLVINRFDSPQAIEPSIETEVIPDDASVPHAEVSRVRDGDHPLTETQEDVKS